MTVKQKQHQKCDFSPQICTIDLWEKYSIYKRLHDVILLPLVTKHNERSESFERSETLERSKTLEEMGAERPEILVF